MSTFLLELRSEEIPARMQAGARAELEKLFREGLRQWNVTCEDLTIWSTPRRLTLIARGLPLMTQPVCEETKGPKANAPEQALAGFLRKTGLTRDQLIERDGVLFAIKDVPGFAIGEVLKSIIFATVLNFSWPKSQRWGASSRHTTSLRWVRPLKGIVALLDGEVIGQGLGVNLDGVEPGRDTMGHRFHSSGTISITDADSYAAQLCEAHVLVDHVERQDIIRAKAAQAATAAGLTLVEDEGLVIENAGLTEWPQPLLGRFDEDFLEVPPEVIQLTARINQKYFVCDDTSGNLANAFICTANIAATDGGAAIVAGNRKVLAARLSDARFFWQQDRKKTLAQHAEGLARITFHEKLGTVADKVERVAKLARCLAEQKIVDADPDLAEQAARLCKADLTTEMVGEFPELQGLMGGYYARAEGLPDAVADAIRDHYKPVGQGDDVPTAPVTVCVALADKLDTLVGFFGQGMPPTGSKDPFALRRAALGIVQLILGSNLRVSSRSLAIRALDFYSDQRLGDSNGHAFGTQNILTADACFVFLIDRLKVQQREAGVRHDLIDAIFALTRSQNGQPELVQAMDAWLADARPDIIQNDDLVRLLARVHALQSFVETQDGKNLLAGYKRAANILKAEDKKGWEEGAQNPTPEEAEAALIAALAQATPKAEAAVEQENFTAAMAALASLRSAVDDFFEQVTVNAAEPEIRSARLSLLSQFRAAVHKVADFSRIEG